MILSSTYNLNKERKMTAIGQLFMVGLPGSSLDDSTRSLIRDYHINNFILFKRNFAGREQLRELCGSLVRACAGNGMPLPLISIDQEGGSVTRLGPPFTRFPDARELASAAEPEAVLSNYARVCARELQDVGINMNLAPVLDVCEAGKGFFMERRSLGHDPVRAAALGQLVITEMQKHGLSACAKHFPGLGAAVVDPHHQLPLVDIPLARLKSVDLLPFRAAVRAGVAAIMSSHTVYPQVDAANPATLSKEILSGLLRNELGYDGLIITDDLEMGAIENAGPLDQAALQAFMAGADILLICHDHQKVVLALRKVAEAEEDGRISQERLQASLDRLALVRGRFAKAIFR